MEDSSRFGSTGEGMLRVSGMEGLNPRRPLVRAGKCPIDRCARGGIEKYGENKIEKEMELVVMHKIISV
jgi:hypothetical protein